jgi:hypothetical protein
LSEQVLSLLQTSLAEECSRGQERHEHTVPLLRCIACKAAMQPVGVDSIRKICLEQRRRRGVCFDDEEASRGQLQNGGRWNETEREETARGYSSGQERKEKAPWRGRGL